ncbi:MAG TPA: EF-Tu/IF-2/RF-3 family GTPase [Candidatus Nitrosocosmicus sp.]
MILGDTSISNELGKKGTSTDITIYDRKTKDQIISYCFANTYPDKLQPLLQSISMSDYAILNISRLDASLGEQILALDVFNIKKGFILYSYDVDVEKIKNIVKKTILSNYQIVENVEQLKTKLSELQANSDLIDVDVKAEKDSSELANDHDSVCIPVDHAFDVKGVGTVILGSIKIGQIKPYDELEIVPSNKSIVIKSIQMHDDPVSFSEKPSRVGLAIKGIAAKDISRGDLITSPGLSKVTTNFQLPFNKNPYYKEDILENQNYMICVGLQIRTVKIKKIDDNQLNITLEKPIAFIKNDICVVFSPDSKSMRIIGHGFMN